MDKTFSEEKTVSCDFGSCRTGQTATAGTDSSADFLPGREFSGTAGDVQPEYHGIFDSHAHYDDAKFDGDRDGMIEYVHSCGVTGIVNIGCTYESMKLSETLAEKYPYVYFSVGLHPSEADICGGYEHIERVLTGYLANPKALAIGEIGLDYHYETPLPEKQKILFEWQMQIAAKNGKPVIIHDRDAHGDTMEILRKYKGVRGVLHSFSGSPEMAEELIKLGYYISFSGVVTFKNAKKLPEVAQAVPADRMLIETDCPYLAPHPKRGERNDSSLLVYVADKLAALRGMSADEVIRITRENAEKLFSIV